jgi:hypothetical protein
MITTLIIDNFLVDELLPLIHGVFSLIDTVIVWTGCGLKVMGIH